MRVEKTPKKSLESDFFCSLNLRKQGNQKLQLTSKKSKLIFLTLF
jgi:hypothetical protein